MNEINEIKEAFETTLRAIAPDVEVNYAEGEATLVVEIHSPKNAGAIIGKGGKTINAIRSVFGSVFRSTSKFRNVRIDYVDK